MAVVNSSEFVRGISTPVGVPTVDLFQQRGFPLEHLLSLSVARVETAGGPISRNTPREPVEARAFQDLLRLLVALGLTTETVREARDVGLPVHAEQINALDRLSDLSNPDVQLVPAAPGLYLVRRLRTVQRFCFGRPPILERPGGRAVGRRRTGSSRARRW